MRYCALLQMMGCPVMRNHPEVTLQLRKKTASGQEGLQAKGSARMAQIRIPTRHPTSSALHKDRVDLPSQES